MPPPTAHVYCALGVLRGPGPHGPHGGGTQDTETGPDEAVGSSSPSRARSLSGAGHRTVSSPTPSPDTTLVRPAPCPAGGPVSGGRRCPRRTAGPRGPTDGPGRLGDGPTTVVLATVSTTGGVRPPSSLPRRPRGRASPCRTAVATTSVPSRPRGRVRVLVSRRARRRPGFVLHFPMGH